MAVDFPGGMPGRIPVAYRAVMTGRCQPSVSAPDERPEPRPGSAVLVAIAQSVGTAVLADGDVPLFGYLLLVATGLVVSDRHRSPGLILAIAACGTTAYAALGYPSGPTFLGLAVAVTAAMKAGRYLITTLIVSGAAAVWGAATRPSLGQVGTALCLLGGAAVLSEVVSRVAPVVRRSLEEQQRLSEERRRRQASEERLLIARELHDVLGHHLSLINVRAAVGLHLMDRQPDQARIALGTIRDASAEALREVQSVLETLYPSGEAAPRAPAAGLNQLESLTGDAGFPVRVRTADGSLSLPPEVDRAAYRIVREALTNIRRHAGAGAIACVSLDRHLDELMVRIDDDGGGATVAPAPEGNGIAGMRERATTLGGSLTALPLSAGGWRVEARFPLRTPIARGVG